MRRSAILQKGRSLLRKRFDVRFAYFAKHRGIWPVMSAAARTYGTRHVWHDLLAKGIFRGLHLVERLMRAHTRHKSIASQLQKASIIDPGNFVLAAKHWNLLDHGHNILPSTASCRLGSDFHFSSRSRCKKLLNRQAARR